MPMNALFWMLFILTVLLYVLDALDIWPAGSRRGFGLMLLAMIGLLGWRIFGDIVR